MEGEQELTQRKQNLEEEPLVAQENVHWLPHQTRQAAKAMALLLFFSFLMFTVPFCVFFGVRHYIKDYFNLDQYQDNVIAVIAAVLSVNIIIAGYCFIAYHEPEYDDQGNLIQENESKSSLELKQD